MTPAVLPEHLETIAEVAAAFTGFAGLVSVLGRSHLDPKIRLWRVQLMIVTSLAAMFGALAPSIIQLVLPDAEDLWRASAFVLLLLCAGQLTFVYRSMPGEHATGLLRTFYSPMAAALSGNSLAIQLALAAVVLDFIPAAAPALYSYGLLFLLVASSFHFLILVRSAQPDAVS
jgi:hypothetical protein